MIITKYYVLHTVDIHVLAEMVAARVPAGMDVWLAFGAGKHFLFLATDQMAACPESEKSFAFLRFHTLPWCDTTCMLAFVGHGNIKTALAAWSSFTELNAKRVFCWS